jgi:hypothetical protein
VVKASECMRAGMAGRSGRAGGGGLEREARCSCAEVGVSWAGGKGGWVGDQMGKGKREQMWMEGEKEESAHEKSCAALKKLMRRKAHTIF